MSVDVDALDEVLRGLRYESTLARSLVHRRAVHEVALTDVADIGERRFAVAAQLPVHHPYYTDHPADPGAHDLLLLLECCRQAATYVAHTRLGVPPGSAFLTVDWRIVAARAQALAHRGDPGELAMTVTVGESTIRRGRLRKATIDIGLYLSGRYAGAFAVTVAYLSRDEYALVRNGSAPGGAMLSDALPASIADAVPAGVLGRADQRNVVLADARADAGGLTARLAVLPGHGSYFDHPLDHYSSMILAEAARQAGSLVLGTPAGARTPRLTGLTAAFPKFAGLDAPVLVGARPRAAIGSAAIRSVEVRFVQRDVVVASSTATFEEHHDGAI